jgi:hypothetical protein
MQYERLRAAALGSALPAEARGGLTVFLQRGMWAWARAIALGLPRREPLPTVAVRPSDLNNPGDHRGLIRRLAAMVMTFTERRTA